MDEAGKLFGTPKKLKFAKKLGRFHRVQLPDHGNTSPLELLGLMNIKTDNKNKNENENEDTYELWHRFKDNGKPIILVGVTGCGKTYKYMRAATAGYLIFITAADRSDLLDPSYKHLLKLVENNVDKENRRLISCFIACRLAGLLTQLFKYNISPTDYFYGQFNSNSIPYSSLLEKITDIKNPEKLCKELIQVIRLHQQFKQHGLIGCAFDECGVMDKHAIGKFTSKTSIQPRAMLYGVSDVVKELQTSVKFDLMAYAGTTFSMKIIKAFMSDGGRGYEVDYYLKFPFFLEKRIIQMFSKLVNYNNDKNLSRIASKLIGRPRLTMLAIIKLGEIDNVDGESTDHVIERAVTESYNQIKDSCVEKILERANDNKMYDDHTINGIRVMMYFHLFQKNPQYMVKNPQDCEIDLVNAGICHTRQAKEGFVYFMSEPLSIDIALSFLDRNKQDFRDWGIRLIRNSIMDCINNNQADGKAAEKIMAAEMTRKDTFKHFARSGVVPLNLVECVESIEFDTIHEIEKSNDDSSLQKKELELLENGDGICILPSNNMGFDILIKKKTSESDKSNVLALCMKTTSSGEVSKKETTKNLLQLDHKLQYTQKRGTNHEKKSEATTKVDEFFEKNVKQYVLLDVCLPNRNKTVKAEPHMANNIIHINESNIHELIRDHKSCAALKHIWTRASISDQNRITDYFSKQDLNVVPGNMSQQKLGDEVKISRQIAQLTLGDGANETSDVEALKRENQSLQQQLHLQKQLGGSISGVTITIKNGEDDSVASELITLPKNFEDLRKLIQDRFGFTNPPVISNEKYALIRDINVISRDATILAFANEASLKKASKQPVGGHEQAKVVRVSVNDVDGDLVPVTQSHTFKELIANVGAKVKFAVTKVKFEGGVIKDEDTFKVMMSTWNGKLVFVEPVKRE
ncbi:hypothetical protein AKO1_014964 [Acrasis kona]|uniref:Uncharacterized protein n=1 Tax=Acrasis kona TaxID=1008807 RepID=A0AAW2Z1B8_9EUKA